MDLAAAPVLDIIVIVGVRASSSVARPTSCRATLAAAAFVLDGHGDMMRVVGEA